MVDETLCAACTAPRGGYGPPEEHSVPPEWVPLQSRSTAAWVRTDALADVHVCGTCDAFWSVRHDHRQETTEFVRARGASSAWLDEAHPVHVALDSWLRPAGEGPDDETVRLGATLLAAAADASPRPLLQTVTDALLDRCATPGLVSRAAAALTRGLAVVVDRACADDLVPAEARHERRERGAEVEAGVARAFARTPSGGDPFRETARELESLGLFDDVPARGAPRPEDALVAIADVGPLCAALDAARPGRATAAVHGALLAAIWRTLHAIRERVTARFSTHVWWMPTEEWELFVTATSASARLAASIDAITAAAGRGDAAHEEVVIEVPRALAAVDAHAKPADGARDRLEAACRRLATRVAPDAPATFGVVTARAAASNLELLLARLPANDTEAVT